MIRTILRTYKAAFSGLPREAWLLAFVALVNRAGSMVLPFFSLYLTRVRGLSIAQAGQTLSLYGLGAIAGSLVGGWMTDRVGALRSQQISLLASGIGFLVFTRLQSLVAISIGIFLLSLVVEAFRPGNMAAFAQIAPPHAQARAFGLLRLAANLGLAAGPALGGLLALHSYNWLFVADAVTCWIAAVLLATLIGELPDKRDESVAVGPPRSPWTDGPFLALLGVVLVVGMIIFQIFTTLPVYLREVCGFRENGIGLLIGLNGLIIVTFEMPLTHWAERRDRLRVAGLGALLMGGGLALMPFSCAVAYIALTIAVWTTGEMLILPMLSAVVAGRAGAATRGRYMGAYSMAFSAAFVVAPVLGTFVYERAGPSILWFGVGATGLLLMVAIWALRPLLRLPSSGSEEKPLVG